MESKEYNEAGGQLVTVNNTKDIRIEKVENGYIVTQANYNCYPKRRVFPDICELLKFIETELK